MSRRHNRRRKEERRERIKRDEERDEERLFAPRESSPDTEQTVSPPRRRLFSFGVRGGWSMDFVTSGVQVPFDPEAKEAPPLKELTLGAMIAGKKPEGED